MTCLKRWYSRCPIIPSFAAFALLGLFLYAISALISPPQEIPGAWLHELLSIMGSALIIWVVCGIWRGPSRELPDAPSHQHRCSLQYIAGLDGWRILCRTCRRSKPLPEDIAFYIRIAAVVAWIALSFLCAYLLHLPDPYDHLHIYIAMPAAQFIAHGSAWLLLRGRDLSAWFLDETADSSAIQTEE